MNYPMPHLVVIIVEMIQQRFTFLSKNGSICGRFREEKWVNLSNTLIENSHVRLLTSYLVPSQCHS